MNKMFKLLENELDLLYSRLEQASICVQNVESFSEYILEIDTKCPPKYKHLTHDISQRIFKMGETISAESEKIQKMKKDILELL